MDRANDDLVAWKHRTPTLDDSAAPPPRTPSGPAVPSTTSACRSTTRLTTSYPMHANRALERFAQLGIRWHDGWRSGPSNHLRSSQVQCVNALMPFVDDPQSLAAIFGSVLPIETVVPFGDPGAAE